MDRIDELAQQSGVGRGEDAVSKIENMPGTIVGPTQDIVHRFFNDRPGREHHRGVKVALNAMIVAYACPRIVQIDATGGEVAS